MTLAALLKTLPRPGQVKDGVLVAKVAPGAVHYKDLETGRQWAEFADYLPSLAGGADIVADDLLNLTLKGTDGTYATARGTYGGTTGGEFSVGQMWNGTYSMFYVFRPILRFGTHTIGAGNNVTQVNLKLTCSGNWSLTDFDVVITQPTLNADWPSNFADSYYDHLLVCHQDDSIWRNTAGMATSTPYTSGNLDTTWVNVTGDTDYGLISSRDLGANEPPKSGNVWEYLDLVGPGSATPSYRPTLIVAYEAASVAKSQTDTITIADTIAVSSTLPVISDTITASDTIAVSSTLPAITDTVLVADLIGIGKTFTLADDIAANDSVLVNSELPTIGDTVSVTEAVVVAVQVPIAETLVAVDVVLAEGQRRPITGTPGVRRVSRRVSARDNG